MSIIDGISSNLTILNKTDDSFTKTTQNTPDFVVYTFPVLIIVGTICNILTFLVMRRKKLRHQSTGFYMAVLAIADELALLLGCLSQWLWSYKKINILTISTYACKIFSVVLYTTFDFSVWMVVIMTIERFIAVTFPLKSMYFCTVKKAKIATLILTCILFSINSHFLYTHSNIDRGNVSGCQSNNESFDFFMQHLWPWIDATKYAFTPFLIILVFNVLIIYNLFIAAKSIKNLSSNHQLQVNHITHGNSNSPNLKDANNHGNANSQSSSSNNRRLTIMLLVVSVTFCILSTPVVILQVFDRTSPGSTSMFFYNICINLQYVNHSINFFLYVISGKLFRHEFIALFCDLLDVFKRVSKYKKSKPVDNFNLKFNNRSCLSAASKKKCTSASSSLYAIDKTKANSCEFQKSNHPSSLLDSDVVEVEPIMK